MAELDGGSSLDALCDCNVDEPKYQNSQKGKRAYNCEEKRVNRETQLEGIDEFEVVHGSVLNAQLVTAGRVKVS